MLATQDVPFERGRNPYTRRGVLHKEAESCIKGRGPAREGQSPVYKEAFANLRL